MNPVASNQHQMKEKLNFLSFHTLLLGDHGAMTDGITVVVRESILVIYCRVKCLGSDYDGLRLAYFV